ncbi:MAG: hypothetical protein WD512_01805 [Candidatus Paceibacterota bacterium]
MSAHRLGKAADFKIPGMTANDIRKELIEKENLWPYPFRLEDDVSWVHMDLYNNSDDKVKLFKA